MPAAVGDVGGAVERNAGEDEVLAEGGVRLSALQLRQQCLASREGVEDDDLPVSGLVVKHSCTFCDKPVSRKNMWLIWRATVRASYQPGSS